MYEIVYIHRKDCTHWFYINALLFAIAQEEGASSKLTQQLNAAIALLHLCCRWPYGNIGKGLLDWRGKHLGVSENRGTPKSSILIGISIINHPFWGIPNFGNTHHPARNPWGVSGFTSGDAVVELDSRLRLREHSPELAVTRHRVLFVFRKESGKMGVLLVKVKVEIRKNGLISSFWIFLVDSDSTFTWNRFPIGLRLCERASNRQLLFLPP